jgi:hypothetical protein
MRLPRNYIAATASISIRYSGRAKAETTIAVTAGGSLLDHRSRRIAPRPGASDVLRNTSHRLRVEGRAVILVIDAIKG